MFRRINRLYTNFYIKYQLYRKCPSLNFDDCSLRCLPTLHDNTTKLSCFNNKLTTIPQLPPSIKDIYCCNNYLTCFPKIPDTLRILFETCNPFLYNMSNVIGNKSFGQTDSYNKDAWTNYKIIETLERRVGKRKEKSKYMDRYINHICNMY